jgi:hypothetical protein
MIISMMTGVNNMDSVVVELTRDELELIRTSLRTQANWYDRGDFKGMALSADLLKNKISDIIIEVSGKVRS